VGKTHLAIGLGRKVTAMGASCLFVPAMGLVQSPVNTINNFQA